MPALQNDLDIREALVSIEEKPTIQHARLIGAQLWDLLIQYARASRDERLDQIKWPKWPAIMDPAYACGFVCGDAGEAMCDEGKTPVSEKIKALKRSAAGLEQLTLRDLRRIVHYIMRSERCGNAGQDTEGGAVWDLITLRLGDALAGRQ
ncbi:MAG: hypothetical protein RIQ75_1491 [Pseudomonadota bacterium]|jgi:hypothetical protein